MMTAWDLRNDTNTTGDRIMVLSCWAERGPNWTNAHDTLGLGYEGHSHILASGYAVMFFYAIYAIIATIRRHQVRKHLGVALHAMIAMTSLTRSMSLFVDPYGLKGLIPCPYNVIIWSFGWPGIVSSYNIFFLAVLESTNLSIMSPRYQRLSILLGIIAVCIAYVIFSDLLVSYIPSSIIPLVVCEILFILWALVLSVGFVYIGWKMRKNLSASCPRNAQDRRRSSADGSVFKAHKHEVRRLNRLLVLLSVITIICSLLTLSHIEPLIDVFHISALDFIAQPSNWIIYQTGQRLLEISMCVVIMTAMYKSSRDRQKKSSKKERTVPEIDLANGRGNEAFDSHDNRHDHRSEHVENQSVPEQNTANVDITLIEEDKM